MRLQEKFYPSANTCSLRDLPVLERCAKKRDHGEVTSLPTVHTPASHPEILWPLSLFIPPSHSILLPFMGFLLSLSEETTTEHLVQMDHNAAPKPEGQTHCGPAWNGKPVHPERCKSQRTTSLQGHITQLPSDAHD